MRARGNEAVYLEVVIPSVPEKRELFGVWGRS